MKRSEIESMQQAVEDAAAPLVLIAEMWLLANTEETDERLD